VSGQPIAPILVQEGLGGEGVTITSLESAARADAWDHLARPVDTDQMLSVLRSWLRR